MTPIEQAEAKFAERGIKWRTSGYLTEDKSKVYTFTELDAMCDVYPTGEVVAIVQIGERKGVYEYDITELDEMCDMLKEHPAQPRA